MVAGKCRISELTFGDSESGARLPDPANGLFEVDRERLPSRGAPGARYENCLARSATSCDAGRPIMWRFNRCPAFAAERCIASWSVAATSAN